MKRLVIAIVLSILLISLNTYYYLYHEKYEEYPGNKEVIEGITGEVSIGGTVISKDSDSFYILVKHGHKSKTIKVLSDLNVEKGDRVEVLGLLQQNKIVPEKTMVYKKWSYYSIFIRSALAIPIVAYTFFKYWSFDLREMKFRRKKNA